MPSHTPLKIGTLSSELQGSQGMRLIREGKSATVIKEVIQTHRPDILVTAGHSLGTVMDLEELNCTLKNTDWNGIIFVEVAHYFHGLSPIKSLLPTNNHCLFAWTRASGWKYMGRQYFATSQQVRTALENTDASGHEIDAFIKTLPDREITFRNLRFGGLICGEINSLQGRNSVAPRTPEIGNWLRSLDVIVNGTHDMMGNAGTLIAKRKWLSQGGRLYLSASNWNSMKAGSKPGAKPRCQNRNARTLHTVFWDGQDLTAQSVSRSTSDYEYRETLVPFPKRAAASQSA